MQIIQPKDTLRRIYLQIRLSMLPREKAEKDALIVSRVLQSEAYLAARTVLCYVSMPNEIDTSAILADAWRRGKRVALPRCHEKGQMAFYLVSSSDDLVSGTFGIPEPNDACPLYLPQPDDLCIVPCLAMDEQGFRLGHGGGYYDRYLSLHPMRTLGLCYASCMTHALPIEPFDIPIQMLVSDKEV